jgi:transcriptional regulator with XRE-family HTH domain
VDISLPCRSPPFDHLARHYTFGCILNPHQDTVNSERGSGMETARRESKTPDKIDVLVGSRIRMRRLMVGMSQSKLAEGLEVTFQQVQKYEKGTNRVGASRLQMIAKVLDIEVSFFFSEQGRSRLEATEACEPFETAAFIANREALEINKAFVRIKSSKVRKAIVALAKELATDQAAEIIDPPNISRLSHDRQPQP